MLYSCIYRRDVLDVYTPKWQNLRRLTTRLVGLASALALVALPATAHAQEWTVGYTDGISNPQGAAAVIYNADVEPLINCASPNSSTSWDMVAGSNTANDWVQTGEGVDYGFGSCTAPYYFVQFELPNSGGTYTYWTPDTQGNNSSSDYWTYNPAQNSEWCGYVQAINYTIQCYYDPLYPVTLEYASEVDASSTDAYTQGENSDHASFTTLYYYTTGGSWVVLPNDLTYCYYPVGPGCSGYTVNYYAHLSVTSAPAFEVWDCRVSTNQC